MVATESTPVTKYGEVDEENGLRIVHEGIGPHGRHEKLTKANGDGTAQVCIECTLDPGQAQAALEFYADDLLNQEAAKLGCAKPKFEFEAPTRWAVGIDGQLLKPGQMNKGEFVYRQLFRYQV